VTSQPGWHPDPTQSSSGPQYEQPALLRYWDGNRWTEHTAPAQAPASSQVYAAPQVYGGPPAEATTPDGVPLAGWWWRALALIIDVLILSAILVAVAFPWVSDVTSSYGDWFDEVLSSDGGGVGTRELQDEIAGPLLVIGAINIALGFVYNVGFLRWKQATPGKLMLGLRVRLRETPGPMSLGTVLLRWVGQYAVGIVSLVPFVGSIGGLYSIVNYLWPLWDSKKQALHDKLAKTNVVRIR
jgi:uncharacterized RDD family membrane protein YckC